MVTGMGTRTGMRWDKLGEIGRAPFRTMFRGEGYGTRKPLLDLELGRDVIGMTFFERFLHLYWGGRMKGIGSDKRGSGSIGGYYWQERRMT